MVVFVLLLIAVILLGLAAFGVGGPVHLGWAGMCLFVLTFLINAWPGR